MDQKQYDVFKDFIQGKPRKDIAEEKGISKSRVAQIVQKVCRTILSYTARQGGETDAIRAKVMRGRYDHKEDLAFWVAGLENLRGDVARREAKKELIKQQNKHRSADEHHLGYLHDSLIGYRAVAYFLMADYRIVVQNKSPVVSSYNEALVRLSRMKKHLDPDLVYGIQEVHVQEPMRVVTPLPKK